MLLYKSLIRKLLFKFNPETAHKITFGLIKLPFVSQIFKLLYKKESHLIKSFNYKNLYFQNRIGLAAGLDKDGEAIKSISALGFGFIEVGTVTPKPQPGNDKPRLFRLIDQEAIINRMGFNNKGVENIKNKLKKVKNKKCIIGVNIGKNKTTPLEEAYKDYVYCFKELFEFADYFAINVSSPNTADLRKLQEPEYLEKILQELQNVNKTKEGKKPIFLKIAPDLENSSIDTVIELVKKHNIDGIIATNTTIDRSIINNDKYNKLSGGLSGKPLKNKSNEIIKYLKSKSNNQYIIIGVGGVSNFDDYQEKLNCGADLVQIYTSFIYEGPDIVKQILKKEITNNKNKEI